MDKQEKTRSEKKRQTMSYGALEKCRAVLLLWTERRKPAEICREMSIAGMVLAQWQNRAMEGMLQALEPRVNLDKGPALSPRLQAMLEKKRLAILAGTAQGRLEKKLAKAQETRKPGTPPANEEKPSEKILGDEAALKAGIESVSDRPSQGK
ncbi:MAG: hypothetical protein M0Z48_05970 [Nitrospiraceae bacterium]|nr:hypothetical protein [Nitrospiraceae bacterium]